MQSEELLEELSAGGAADVASGEGPLLEESAGVEAGAPDVDVDDVEREAAAAAAAISGLRPGCSASWARGTQPSDWERPNLALPPLTTGK